MDLTIFFKQAGNIAQEIANRIAKEQPATAAELGELVAARAAQFNLVIRDVKGGMPCIDLVAVTASGEQAVGSILCRRLSQSSEA